MTKDRVRSLLVAVTALAQLVSSPLTTLALGPSSDTGSISDANASPITPAGYAFAIWGLIYVGCLALAGYQVRRDQLARPVHRRTGWWLVGAFTASAVWIPVFGSRRIWLSQLVILALVACLAFATAACTAVGPAETSAERLLLRLPVTRYLGWATLATAASFGVTFRSLGMPADAGWVRLVCLGLLAVAAGVSALVVCRASAVAGFTFTACWALVAVAVATYAPLVRYAALVAVVAVLGLVAIRVGRSRRPAVVLWG